jgi:hypothetical protein
MKWKTNRTLYLPMIVVAEEGVVEDVDAMGPRDQDMTKAMMKDTTTMATAMEEVEEVMTRVTVAMMRVTVVIIHTLLTVVVLVEEAAEEEAVADAAGADAVAVVMRTDSPLKAAVTSKVVAALQKPRPTEKAEATLVITLAIPRLWFKRTLVGAEDMVVGSIEVEEVVGAAVAADEVMLST